RDGTGLDRDRSLREELTCAICCELFSEPVMLDCMHHFCKGCIQEYWDSCAHVPSCPQCRRKFPNRAFRTNYLLSGLVEKVRRCSSGEHQQKMQCSVYKVHWCTSSGPAALPLWRALTLVSSKMLSCV
uniref:RING-type domain-containing protein n=1 Tax=Malurus cyaneus samueli TaxID=2593467 RepID=A0A8C5UF18_9PASS